MHTDTLAADLRAGNRSALSRAITLIESTATEHQAQASALLEALLPFTGTSHRIGITGTPGVGKSTLIDRLGCTLTAAGHRVAVLAVDPSSSRTGGSILGDKTRMARLSQDPAAFIRPSPTSGTLGGVARRTRETILLVEAAGFDIVIVETVGVGQSEIAVAGMVDCFVALMLPGAGDELQALKKGLIEIADIIVVNKADGDGLASAQRAQADYQGALHIVAPIEPDWRTPVVLVSALENRGLDELWAQIMAHRLALTASGATARRRQTQAVAALHENLQYQLLRLVRRQPQFTRFEQEVRQGLLTPSRAADELMRLAGL